MNQKNYDWIDSAMDKMPLVNAQSLDRISQYIKNNFETESDRIRAVYYWTAHTISYDVDNMYEVKFDKKLQERIAKAFHDKKGVCFDYANIFKQLANSVGIKTIVITGYTKWDGKKIDNLSHAWNAARIDNQWYLFDSTWGAGYVSRGVFIRQLDNKYFKVNPEIMINTHMPFDYLWQFKEYPITNQGFIQGDYFDHEQIQKLNFEKEIKRFENLTKVEQLREVAQRIEQGGLKNQQIVQAYQFANTAFKNAIANEKNKEYNQIVDSRNEAIKQFNDFINYRNNQFQPTLSDEEILNKIVEPRYKLIECQLELDDFEKNPGSVNKTNIENLRKSNMQILAQMDKHLHFVNVYLSRPIAVRKMLFYRTVTR